MCLPFEMIDHEYKPRVLVQRKQFDAEIYSQEFYMHASKLGDKNVAELYI